jgi:hypothetical protein
MPLRSFHVDGTEWTVWDTHPGSTGQLAAGRLSVAAGYGQGWLTFQCEAEKRRLVPVPAGWFELSEHQLGNLLKLAAPVRRAPDVRL